MVLSNRKFLLLWHGQLVSQLGSQAFLIASTYVVLEATDSAQMVAAVMVAASLPRALLGPLAGPLVDRHSRRTILVLSDVSRAMAVGALAMLLLARPPSSVSLLWLVAGVAVFNGVMSALFLPALQALIPDLVATDELPAANSLYQFSSQGSALLGQAIGGVLYVALGAPVLLLMDAASFAYAGLAAWLLPRDDARPREGARAASTRWMFADMRRGIAFVSQQPGLLAVLLTFTGVNFLFMPVLVLLPFYVRETLGQGAAWYGFLLAASSAGAVTGSMAAALTLHRVRARGALVRSCVLAVAGCVLGVAWTQSAWAAMAAFAGIGALSSVINVAIITGFQTSVPAELRGRVMALVMSLSTAAVPLGMGVGGLLGDMWRDSLRVIFTACGAGMFVLVVITVSSRGFHEMLDMGRGDEPTES